MRTKTHFANLTSALFIGALVSGCNGSSGKNEEVTPPDPDAPQVLSTVVLDKDCQAINTPSQEAGSTFCIQASLTKNSEAVVNTTVNFTAPLGTLSPSSKITNSNGVAQVMLSSTLSDIGAADIVASSGEATSNASYEFVASNSGETDLPQIAVAMFKSGVANNRFKQGESVEIQATLLDGEGSPLENQRVAFAAELGTLNVAASLTDSQGIATANLTSGADGGIGAAILNVSYAMNEDENVSQQFNYQILDADSIITEQIKAGYFNEQGSFIENQMQLTVPVNQSNLVELAAGGTLGVAVTLVDENLQPLTTPTAINFSSNCTTNQKATIDQQVLTINGTANATYKDISCAGAEGNQDQIVATIDALETNITITQGVALSGENLGSIEFLSAEPDSIVLKGTGGVNKKEISTLTFKVVGELDNPLSQQQVTFNASTNVGGLEVKPLTALTNSEGEVSTKVISGNVPTAVRVTATAQTQQNETIQTQSDLLSINTGLADQNSISLSAVTLNPETDNFNGIETEITAWLADSFNNPVPDGTTVNFTTEGGQIDASCQTTNGSCSVIWESADPRVFNHRVTILATALGHETFFDTNGSNTFDDADGDAIVNQAVSSGFGRTEYQPSGFIDTSEAWRDDNEDNIFQVGETFIDFDQNGAFTPQDSLFNGPHCSGAKCASAQSTHVRKALRLIMASGASIWTLNDSLLNTTIATSNAPTESVFPALPIAFNSSREYTLSFADIAMQTLPIGSTVSISSDIGELVGTTSFTVTNNASGNSRPISQSEINSETGTANITIADAKSRQLFGGQQFSFVLKNTLGDDEPSESAVLSISITSPSGVKSDGLATVLLEGNATP